MSMGKKSGGKGTAVKTTMTPVFGGRSMKRGTTKSRSGGRAR